MFTTENKIKLPLTSLISPKNLNQEGNRYSNNALPKYNLNKDTVTFTSNLGKDNKINVESTVKSVKGKKFQGAGLFDSKDGYIIWDKVGYKFLDQEPLDWSKPVSKAQYLAYQHALSLAENKEDPRVTRYNPENVKAPLALPHFLFAPSAIDYLVENINKLEAVAKSPNAPAFLKQPVINPKTGKLNINITVFDTETTGTTNKDKIVQLGGIKIGPDGNIIQGAQLSQLVNPGVPIPPGASKVHGITDEDVKDKPRMESLITKFVRQYLKNDVIVAYNAKFDIPFLNREISSYNQPNADRLPEEKLCLAIDPIILIQRIHPFVSASKKLQHVYRYTFCNGMEGAHDALSDVKGTVDILKYCLYYLQKNASRPLTVKDILDFQFGRKVEGLNIQFKPKFGYDKNKAYNESYKIETMGVKGYVVGYRINLPIAETDNLIKEIKLKELIEQIGEENVKILDENNGKNSISKDRFQESLEKMGIKPYNGKSLEEVIDIITEHSAIYENKAVQPLRVKNVKESDVPVGNDLPDIEISKRVMLERYDQNKSEQGSEKAQGRELLDILKDLG